MLHPFTRATPSRRRYLDRVLAEQEFSSMARDSFACSGGVEADFARIDALAALTLKFVDEAGAIFRRMDYGDPNGMREARDLVAARVAEALETWANAETGRLFTAVLDEMANDDASRALSTRPEAA